MEHLWTIITAKVLSHVFKDLALTLFIQNIIISGIFTYLQYRSKVENIHENEQFKHLKITYFIVTVFRFWWKF